MRLQQEGSSQGFSEMPGYSSIDSAIGLLKGVARAEALLTQNRHLKAVTHGFKQLYESLPSLLSPYARLGSS